MGDYDLKKIKKLIKTIGRSNYSTIFDVEANEEYQMYPIFFNFDMDEKLKITFVEVNKEGACRFFDIGEYGTYFLICGENSLNKAFNNIWSFIDNPLIVNIINKKYDIFSLNFKK